MRYISPAHLDDELDVLCQGLHAVEAGHQTDGDPTVRVHLPPEEKVTLQVVTRKVVLAAKIQIKP